MNNCNCICHTLGKSSESVCTHCECKKPETNILALGKSLGWFGG